MKPLMDELKEVTEHQLAEVEDEIIKCETEGKIMDDRVIITRPVVGICHMQICVVEDASDEEIIDVCNKENPSGTAGGWGKVERHDVVSCDKYPGRKHMCVAC